MKSSVIIKGNKYGFQIVLNPTLPFEELLREVGNKFKESTHFFDLNKPIAVSFTGRELTSGEQNLLVDTISENSGLNISCVIDGAKVYSRTRSDAFLCTGSSENSGLNISCVIDGAKVYETQFAKVLNEIREEEKKEKKQQEAESFPENRIAKNGQFYRGTLRSGQKIEVDGSIVILGDINPGAQIVAGGNVVVLGCLKGTVHAGYPEDNSAFVAALMMEPMQIQIGSYIARSPDQRVKNTKKNAKKKNRQELLAKLAFVENDSIFIETITRSLISEISIS